MHEERKRLKNVDSDQGNGSANDSMCRNSEALKERQMSAVHSEEEINPLPLSLQKMQIGAICVDGPDHPSTYFDEISGNVETKLNVSGSPGASD